MSHRTWKTGIVGCGRIAGREDHPRADGPVETHAQAYYRHPNFELVAAVDPSVEELHRFQQAWHIPRSYQSLAEMLDNEQLDVLSLCTPAKLHFSQAMEIMVSRARPKVLFVEKPICLKAEELAHLMELTQQTTVEIIVNHTRRFDPSHRKVAQLVQSGELGSLIQGRCTYYGGWLNNGTHQVDTVRMFFGAEPQVISAVVSSDGRAGDCNVDAQFLVGNSKIFLEAFDEAYYQLFESEFRFEAGRIRPLDFGSNILIEQVTVNEIGEQILLPTEDSPMQGLVSPLYGAVESIDAALRGHSIFHELGVDLSAAALTMRAIWQARDMATEKDDFASLESLETERWIADVQ